MTRPYTLGTRGEAKNQTRERIVEAAEFEFSLKWFDEVSLQGIANAAGVGIQTVLRHFPTKETLFQWAAKGALERADQTRSRLPTTSLQESLTVLWDYFEAYGALILHYLDQLDRSSVFVEITSEGSAAHRRWAQHLFGTFLDVDDPSVQLLLDVRTWEFLRHRLGLSRVDAQSSLSRLVSGLIRQRE